MKHLLKKSALAAAALASLGSAQAAIITFDAGLDTSEALFAPLITHGDALYQSGFLVAGLSNAPGAEVGFDLVGSLVDGADIAGTCAGVVCPSNNSTTFYAGLNDGYIYLAEQTDSDVAFTIAGFSASFLANGTDPIPTGSASGLLRIQGVKADGTGSITQTFQLAPASANGSLSFTDYVTSGVFATTQFKYAFIFGFYCDTAGSCTNAFTNDKGQFAIDNINVTAVPEPASWGLMGLGLAGIAAFARRRRAA